MVSAQFVQVGERRVLVRHAGRGPALVLLHQSPQSSAALLPLIERFASRYAVFAPDTPGFGLSDPLSLAQPTIPALAAAVSALLDALGLERVLIYGVHTGASIAARLAQDRPERVAALVCDGLALFDADERQTLLDGYLPPFEPKWDGTHLLWLWARLREQTIFFPWHQGTRQARLHYPLATTPKLQADVMDLLAAGDGYRAGYRAPLLYTEGVLGASMLSVPTKILYRAADPLSAHFKRLPHLQPSVQAQVVADAEELAEVMRGFLDLQSGAASTALATAQVASAVAPSRRRVSTATGALALQIGPGNPEQTTLLLPDIGQAAIDEALPPGPGRTLVLDLPGHGGSDRWLSGSSLSAEALAEAVLHAVETLHTGPLRLRAVGGSAPFAAAIARQLGTRCTELTLIDPLPLDEAEAAYFLGGLPDLEPHGTGAHLLAAWSWARLRHLFWPWAAPTAAAGIVAPAPPPWRVHGQVVAMLTAGPDFSALWHAALEPALLKALQPLACPLTLETSDDSERCRLAARLAQPLGLQPQAAPAGRVRLARPGLVSHPHA